MARTILSWPVNVLSTEKVKIVDGFIVVGGSEQHFMAGLLEHLCSVGEAVILYWLYAWLWMASINLSISTIRR